VRYGVTGPSGDVVAAGRSTSSTNDQLVKRVRVAYDNRVRELKDQLDQLIDHDEENDDPVATCQTNAAAVDSAGGASLGEKRLTVLLRQLNQLKRENVSCSWSGSI